jgi:hypothetical protein
MAHYTSMVFMLQPTTPATARHMHATSTPHPDTPALTDSPTLDPSPDDFTLDQSLFGPHFAQWLPAEMKLRVFACLSPSERFTCAAVSLHLFTLSGIGVQGVAPPRTGRQSVDKYPSGIPAHVGGRHPAVSCRRLAHSRSQPKTSSVTVAALLTRQPHRIPVALCHGPLL